jgi:hypothetical protein
MSKNTENMIFDEAMIRKFYESFLQKLERLRINLADH